MKNLTLALFFSIFLVSTAFCGEVKIRRTTSNGGFWGYSNTEAKWVGNCCVITCSEPGWTSCPTRCLTQSTAYGLLIEQAETLVLQGLLSGTLYNVDINAFVRWVAVLNEQGTYNIEFIVVQE